jgi:hypothetical protein
VVYHHHHASGGKHERFLYAGRLRFARYYRPWAVPMVMFGLLAAAFKAWWTGKRARLRLLLSPGLWWEGLTRPAEKPSG